MFSNFSDAIKSRNKENIKSEFTFIGVKNLQLKNTKKKDNFCDSEVVAKLFLSNEIKIILLKVTQIK